MPKLTSATLALDAIRGSAARHALGYADLFRRFVHLYRARRFSPYEIHFFDLLNPAFSDQALDSFMSRDEGIDLDRRHVLETYLCATSDKTVFYAMCAAAGVPVPGLLGVFDLPSGWTPDGRLLRSQVEWREFMRSLPQEFVVKPALGLLGKGVTVFRRQQDAFVGHDGQRRSPDQLYEFLCRGKELNLFAAGFSHYSLRIPGDNHKSIIQQRVRAHPAIAQLSGSDALSTCRIVTQAGGSGDSRVLASAIKVISGGNLVDNFDKGALGNLWCNVDAASGRISEAFVKDGPANRLTRITRHPGTGHEVVGFAIPDWERVVRLAHHLATVFRPQPLIHWDIGVATGGPVVIEGNVGGQTMVTPLSRPVRELLAGR